MLENQQTDEYSSYKGYQNPSYQNPTSYQRPDTYQNPLESSEEEEGQSVRNRGGTSPMVQTTPDDIEWDRSLIEKEYKPEDEETRRKNVNRFDRKHFFGSTSGTFSHIDRDELFRNFVEHTIQYFILHNFKKGSAQNLANQIKNCIVIDGHVTGVIIKYTADVLEKNKKKKKKHGHRHHRHRHHHHHHHKHREVDDVPPKAEPDRSREVVDSDEDEDNGPKDQKGFYIQVGYNLTLEAELEKTCLAVFVPFTTYCFGWEPLLDKDYTLHYTLVIRRLRGRHLFNKNIDEAADEAPKDKKTMEKEKGFIGRILNTFLDVAEDKKEKKKEKKEKKEKEKKEKKEAKRHQHTRHQRRGHRHRRHSKHRKQKDSHSSHSDSESDSHSGSASTSDSDSDYSSESSSSGREHQKTRTKLNESQQQSNQSQQQPAPEPDPKPDQQVADQ